MTHAPTTGQPTDALAAALGTSDPEHARAIRYAAENPPLTIVLNLIPQGERQAPQVTIIPSFDTPYEVLESALNLAMAEVRRLERQAYAAEVEAARTAAQAPTSETPPEDPPHDDELARSNGRGRRVRDEPGGERAATGAAARHGARSDPR